ncbi:CLUMA_CG003375, isoform A [Clunio marinus]|uniref:CLUMA_CG003375, isoform A n=1 Tax=Clunio marinus TaxID=568069 RepID=A0A1J1HU12_9DIPT|nr:CLUMA_CG003375, isoform A [Clunio marinus]
MKFQIKFSTNCETFCGFQRNKWTPFGTLNECLVENVEIESRNDKMLSVKTFGHPDDDFDTFTPESDDYDSDDEDYCYDVKSFYIYRSPACHFIPQGISNNFRNLTVLVLSYTGLKSLTNEDLKPFKQLRGLYVDNNLLETLETDLFMYNPKLREISFNENKIKRIAFNILDKLVMLQKAEFYRNHCIDMGAETFHQLENLKLVLKKKFKPRKRILENFDETLEYCKALYEHEE